MATREELRERVSRNLGDASNKRFTVAKVNGAIQEGYNLLTAMTGAIQKSVALPFPSDTPYMNLRAIVPDYFAPLGLWNMKTSKWIPPISQKELNNFRWDWERWVGEPVSGFFVVDFNRICIVPYQTVGTGLFVLWYLAAPNDLSDSQEPILPVTQQHTIADYATGELQDEQKEFIKSGQYIKAFYESVSTTERLINNIAQNDKQLVMQPYMAMPMYGGVGGNPVFVDNITPTGTVNGTNATFELPSIPNPVLSLCLTVNGQLQYSAVSFTLTGTTITFGADHTPQIGDAIRASYRIS